MSDRRLRELERMARMDVGARAAWLRERLRVDERCPRCRGRGWCIWDSATKRTLDPCPECGTLELRRRIGLAAFCGDPASISAIDFADLRERSTTPVYWLTALYSMAGADIPQIIICASAGLALLNNMEEADRPGATWIAAYRAVERADAFVRCPCIDHLDRWRDLKPPHSAPGTTPSRAEVDRFRDVVVKLLKHLPHAGEEMRVAVARRVIAWCGAHKECAGATEVTPTRTGLLNGGAFHPQ